MGRRKRDGGRTSWARTRTRRLQKGRQLRLTGAECSAQREGGSFQAVRVLRWRWREAETDQCSGGSFGWQRCDEGKRDDDRIASNGCRGPRQATQGRALLLDTQESAPGQRNGSADHRLVAAAEQLCVCKHDKRFYPAQREGSRTRASVSAGVSSSSRPNDGGRACVQEKDSPNAGN